MREMFSRSFLVLVAAGLLTSGCKHKVDLFCDQDTPCTDPMLSYCDVNGAHEASGFIGNTCIPDPFAADAGTPPDAGPNAPDADPNAPDADPNAPDAGPQAKVSHVFYTAPITAADKVGLHHAIVTDGVVGTSRELSGPYASGAVGVNSFVVARDRSFLVYQSTESGTRSLYWVDLTMEPPASPVLVSGGSKTSAWYKLEGTSLVFAEDPEADGTFEIRFVRVGSGAPTTPIPLGPSLESSIIAYRFAVLSKDGDHLLFRSSADSGLYYSYVGGASPTAAVRVSASGPTPYFLLAPDSKSLAFIEGPDASAELYYAPIASGVPGARIKLNGTLTNGGGVSTSLFIPGMSYAPDSSFLAYLADERTDGTRELFSVDLRGATPASSVALNGSLAANGDVGLMQVSPDSATVAYWAGQSAAGIQELWLVDMRNPALPATARRVNGGLVSGGDVDSVFGFSPDGQSAYYTADQRTDEVEELFLSDISSGVPAGAQRLNGTLTGGGDVFGDFGRHSAVFSRTGLVYRADQDTDNVRELYYVDLSGATPAPAERVHPALSTGESVHIEDPQVLQGGDTVLYQATIGGTRELWMAPLSGSFPATPIKINAPLAGGDVGTASVVE